jgi:membrane-associated phospholipid phosphatase
MIKIILLFFLISSNLFCTESFLKDGENFYSKNTAKILFTAFLPALILAKSPLDKAIENFYQENIRSEFTDDAAKIFKAFGSNKPLSIAFFSGTFTGYLLKDTKVGMGLYQLCICSLRGITVGMPLLIASQNILGSDRPEDNTHSFYQPFKNDHGVSGHAFMGAVPFINAAFMVKDPVFKAIFFAGSTLTGLSRINDSAHFLSQVLLGWTLAYTSSLAVYQTNLDIQIHQNKVSVGAVF